MKDRAYLVILVFYMLLFIGCSEKQVPIPGVTADILVKYADSGFQNPVDSLFIEKGDTLYFNEKFPLEGYFRLYRWDRTSMEEGEMRAGIKVGRWCFYEKGDEAFLLYKEENYNRKGIRDGKFIYYYDGGPDPALQWHFKDGIQSGIQRSFYPSGVLMSRYETDDAGCYINDYLVFKESGDTLYFENFDSTGTGMARGYTIYREWIWEQPYVNKKKEGWGTEKGDVIVRTLYKNDELIRRVELDEEAADQDSVVLEYLAGEIIREVYKKGS